MAHDVAKEVKEVKEVLWVGELPDGSDAVRITLQEECDPFDWGARTAAILDAVIRQFILSELSYTPEDGEKHTCTYDEVKERVLAGFHSYEISQDSGKVSPVVVTANEEETKAEIVH